MQASQYHPVLLGDIWANFRRRPLRFCLPMVLIAAGVAAYATIRPEYWEASQLFTVRNDAWGPANEQGKFMHIEQLKATEETLQELIKTAPLLQSALTRVGPPEDFDGDLEKWPSAKDVYATQSLVKMVPPKGAEFGTTEVIFVKAQDPDKLRAVALTAVIGQEMQQRFRKIRHSRYASICDELSKAVDLNDQALTASTAALAAMEQDVGSDLAELRILSESLSNNSDLRQRLVELNTEMRQADQSRRANLDLRQMLQATKTDNKRLAAMPNRLLESQPSLRKLKDGLLDAQLRLAQVQSVNGPDHPQVYSAKAAVEEISKSIDGELQTALVGLDADIKYAESRVQTLAAQQSEVQQRLNRLASLRAPYARLSNDVKHRTKTLEESQRAWTDAQASLAGSEQASLVEPQDAPELGIRPVLPNRPLLYVIGVLGGALVGLGVLVLTAAPRPSAREDLAAAIDLTPDLPPPDEVIFRRITRETPALTGNGVQPATPIAHSRLSDSSQPL